MLILIILAMKNLVKPDELAAKAVDVRQELDLKIGCAFTRFQTSFFHGKYGNFDGNSISYGPCQTPALALCVKRHDEILSFQPKSFWTVQATVDLKNSLSIQVLSDRGRIFEKKIAQNLVENLKKKTEAKIVSLSVSQKSLSRPHGYLSYPRTETSKYSSEFDIDFILSAQKNSNSWGHYAEELLVTGYTRPEGKYCETNIIINFLNLGGKDFGDHPPITPMALANEGDLYATLSSNCQYEKTKIVFEIGSTKFDWSGNKVRKAGFTSVMHWRAMSDDLNVELVDSEVCKVSDVRIKEGQTSPPDYLTESDLLGKMESLGIGTDASMATHINNICVRKYVNVYGNQRLLIPTNLGIVLIHGLEKIDAELSSPTLRSNMEKRISVIADGKETPESILSSELSLYKLKFEGFMKNIEKMDQLFEASFSPVSSTGKPFSKCGICKRLLITIYPILNRHYLHNRYMHLLSTKPVRLHCRNCNETYNLPSNGSIKLFRELKCPLDAFELVLFTTGSKGKGYSICPKCYNHPPFENIPIGMSCNNCPEVSCKFSLPNNSIINCPQENCTGVLVLDFTSAPRYKLNCNACNLVSNFKDTVNEVFLKENICEKCFSKQIEISFIKKENKNDLIGCIVCDDELDALLESRVIKFGRRGKEIKVRKYRGNTAESSKNDIVKQKSKEEKFLEIAENIGGRGGKLVKY
ncbi:DNA topoisomerase 3-beta-1 [Clydaea vesicula]|uniref:DNA topoisomerase n=1 Tax=Clydaea vesicula TaxID=447962 RepID=A0AAD5U251_9FUNG|nr:DNA topoisomerase 3-beta-1 [Clydaea vesicula]